MPAERVQLDQGNAFFDREENRAAGLVVSYPQADWGQLEQIGALWSFGDLAPRLERAPPALGEHTREILHELGFDAARIDELEALGAIR